MDDRICVICKKIFNPSCDWGPCKLANTLAQKRMERK